MLLSGFLIITPFASSDLTRRDEPLGKVTEFWEADK
jgi:hypothetical protein